MIWLSIAHSVSGRVAAPCCDACIPSWKTTEWWPQQHMDALVVRVDPKNCREDHDLAIEPWDYGTRCKRHRVLHKFKHLKEWVRNLTVMSTRKSLVVYFFFRFVKSIVKVVGVDGAAITNPGPVITTFEAAPDGAGLLGALDPGRSS
eukprot:1194810-Prorocentrum_minimum.AAC.6